MGHWSHLIWCWGYFSVCLKTAVLHSMKQRWADHSQTNQCSIKSLSCKLTFKKPGSARNRSKNYQWLLGCQSFYLNQFSKPLVDGLWWIVWRCLESLPLKLQSILSWLVNIMVPTKIAVCFFLACRLSPFVSASIHFFSDRVSSCFIPGFFHHQIIRC